MLRRVESGCAGVCLVPFFDGAEVSPGQSTGNGVCGPHCENTGNGVCACRLDCRCENTGNRVWGCSHGQRASWVWQGVSLWNAVLNPTHSLNPVKRVLEGLCDPEHWKRGVSESLRGMLYSELLPGFCIGNVGGELA